MVDGCEPPGQKQNVLGSTRFSAARFAALAANRWSAGLPELPQITPHSLRRTWATFAASIGRDPKWIAAQIGHADPQFTFSVYQQVATRRCIDEQAIWSVMRFADEPAERVKSRQLTRVETDDPRGPMIVERGPFDQFVDDINDPTKRWEDENDRTV